jgi:hypothetical protein
MRMLSFKGPVFLGSAATYLAFSLVPPRDLFITSALAFIQNFVSTMNARFANRGHPGWPVVTGLLTGIMFVVNATFLLGHASSEMAMPISLLVPYVIATVAGSNMGTIASMKSETALGLDPDKHVTEKPLRGIVTWHRNLLVAVAVITGAYIALSGSIHAFFNLPEHTIVVPYTLSREDGLGRSLALLFCGMLFFLNNMTHTLSSRAGNRNNTMYHAITCLLHGLAMFGTSSFIVLNAHYVDVVPVVCLGAALGQLFAQQCSMQIERRLGSVMDHTRDPQAAYRS